MCASTLVLPSAAVSAILGFFRAFYLSGRFFVVGAGVVVLFVLAYVVPAFAVGAQGALVAFVVLAVLDAWLLFRVPDPVTATRTMPDRLSHGDPNAIRLAVANGYRFAIRATVIDELPPVFQVRDAAFTVTLPPGTPRTMRYDVRPTKRGAYAFGAVHVFAESPLGLVQRRHTFEAEGRTVPVYPSYVQMQRYALLAASDRLTEAGVKPIRRVGHTMEFDHVREYVVGDDVRTINWKATARRGDAMVNQYREERGQPVYCVLDMGRVMEMPFEGLTLLDYSINATLALSNIALMKDDKAGLVTFGPEVGPVVPAARRGGQLVRLQEQLYRLETDFRESDFARLALYVRRTLRQRGLLLLFTHFMGRPSLERQLPYLQMLGRQHTVVVIFFENTDLKTLTEQRPASVEEVYVKTIAEKFAIEQREIVRTLRRHGLQALLTPPAQLTVATINRYLELKARGVV